MIQVLRDNEAVLRGQVECCQKVAASKAESCLKKADDVEMKEVVDTTHVEKDRDSLKDLIAHLQKSNQQHEVEAEQLCSDLLSCIFVLQNMEK